MSTNRLRGSATETELALFETEDHRTFDGASPHFKTPVEIGSFSLDINREFENSQKSMRYFIKPSNPGEVNFDLRKGYDTMIKNEQGRKLDVLRWIVENVEKFPIKGRGETKGQNFGVSGRDRPKKDQKNSASSLSQHSKGKSKGDKELTDVQTGLSKMMISKEDDLKRCAPANMSAVGKLRNLNTDFVCRRGLLAKIMCTPYEKMENWLIAVTLHNGTYYLDEVETEERKENEERIKNDEMCAWGWKFEQYLTSVFFGEVDALNVDKEKGSYYVEFKTNREITHPGHEKTFKRLKIKKWWSQSYIMGVQEIVCGFRDENGVVHKLEFYNTNDLPNLAEDLYNPWKPNVCLNFLDQFLSFIKSTITTDDKRIVHTLKWSPGEPVRCSQPLVDSEYNFLPEWYTDAVK
ncbi:decapping and exoribonuclease protein-like isoform X2 [Mercenaria mercenaria]|uniref:decapping and exoribonuclease protein-like isoform X2 n=1 Tax=Mercenaria mercenaria TaxID=6596 RepID=UPI00234F9817|nr:decapping and exoribonuclease protein-like isoform X2 [Mercenaria mercenaria]